MFIYYYLKLKGTEDAVTATGGIDYQSPLIFAPSLRHEAWRFVSYMFLHYGLGTRALSLGMRALSLGTRALSLGNHALSLGTHALMFRYTWFWFK